MISFTTKAIALKFVDGSTGKELPTMTIGLNDELKQYLIHAARGYGETPSLSLGSAALGDPKFNGLKEAGISTAGTLAYMWSGVGCAAGVYFSINPILGGPAVAVPLMAKLGCAGFALNSLKALTGSEQSVTGHLRKISQTYDCLHVKSNGLIACGKQFFLKVVNLIPGVALDADAPHYVYVEVIVKDKKTQGKVSGLKVTLRPGIRTSHKKFSAQDLYRIGPINEGGAFISFEATGYQKIDLQAYFDYTVINLDTFPGGKYFAAQNRNDPRPITINMDKLAALPTAAPSPGTTPTAGGDNIYSCKISYTGPPAFSTCSEAKGADFAKAETTCKANHPSAVYSRGRTCSSAYYGVCYADSKTGLSKEDFRQYYYGTAANVGAIISGSPNCSRR